ncbi:MAG TPA: EamA family transporter [Mycobacteriales bacterium]
MIRYRDLNRGVVLAWSALVVVYLVWGSTYLAIRVGVRDLPPGIMAGIRYLIAGALLYPVAIRTGDAQTRAVDRPGRKQWLACGVVGLLLLVLGNGGVSVAEQTVPSGLAALLVATVPLWMILFAVPIQHQRIGGRAAMGLLLGLIGVAVLAGGGLQGGPLSGALIVLGASAAWGLGSVLGHRLPLPRRVLVAAAIEMLIGGVILLVAAAVGGEFAHVRWGDVHATSWFALIWLILPGSILAFTAYGYSLAHLPVSTVSTYAYVNPVVAVILGTALLNEAFGPREILGAVLVVASVALTLHHTSKPTDEREQRESPAPLERTSSDG